MKIAILLSTLILSCIVHSQPARDSLKSVIQSNRPYADRISAHIELLGALETKDFDETIREGEKALEVARRNSDSIGVAQVKRHIGVANYFKGEYSIAAKNYFESIAILEKSNRTDKLAAVYNDLARLFRKTRDLDKAAENYRKAEDIYRKLKDTSGISTILNESGVVFEYKSDYREALRRYEASLNLAQATGDSLAVSYALSNIAGINVIEKKYQQAESALLRALHIREKLKDSFAIALTYSDLGAAMNKKGDYGRAIDYLEKSNAIAIRMNYPELQSNNYSELASAAQNRGDYQKAYDYFLLKSYLRDSIFALEKAKQIEELRTEYETAEKEERIKQQEERIRLQNYIFIGIAGLVLLTGLLVHSSYRRMKLRREAELKTELLKQQELAAKSVIEAEEKERQRIARDLHDGVGQMMSAAKMNLSAFEAEFPLKNEEQKQTLQRIIQLVDESCREVRTVSHLMMPNALLKNSLANAIHEFTDRLSDPQLKVHVYTSGLGERMPVNIETVLYRVVQECVTNAIRHSGATNLDISLVKENGEIAGTIEDNGKGFDPSSPEGEGLGLKNIRSRIEYLKGKVDFDSRPGRGTVIAFHVPVD